MNIKAGVTSALVLAAATIAQEKMLLSDQSLEPNIIRPLMEQGEWVAIQ